MAGRMDINDIKRSLNAERESYLKQFPQNEDSEDYGQEAITPDDTNKALDFVVKWGKYKGSTYREVYIKDYKYFQITMLGNLMKKLPETYICRALRSLHDPSVRIGRKRKIEEVSDVATQPHSN